MSVFDVLVSLSPACIGALLGVLFTRGYGRWTKHAAARDKARDELDEIMRWRWLRNPPTQGDGEDCAAVRLYDERLPSHLRAAGVPEELISRAEQMDLDRLEEVVDDIHIWLDEADRRHRQSHLVSVGSRDTRGSEKSPLGIPA